MAASVAAGKGRCGRHLGHESLPLQARRLRAVPERIAFVNNSARRAVAASTFGAVSFGAVSFGVVSPSAPFPIVNTR
jgi:hypothetical protein